MTRHKSRVARRSRRRARRGTRKQSGGFLGWLFGSKPDDAEPAQSASIWDKLNPFKSKKPQPEVISAAAQNTNPPPAGPPPPAAPVGAAPVGAAVQSPLPDQGGGRKTRHRRRSPRRHHK